ncbi:hypothetical protein CANINC_000639 [Pichia inconspicua]|uniref:DUF2415 domain-containing protein n=1 Tax=Pichia inconspicua TaxID=52247 RepID=A0A4T0X5Y7_9ASCO|nr:hypothetical protein CANINC_000639 [[Candida] inconspicua]
MAVSAPHWQLKDMLVVSKYSDPCANELYNADPHILFPHKNRIFTFPMSECADCGVTTKTLLTDKQNTIRFATSPRCLQQLDDIIVAGGVNSVAANTTNSLVSVGLHKGSFSVHNTTTQLTKNFQVGEFINNCVTINKSPTSSNNHYISYLCNNDKYLHRYDITNSRITPFGTPVYLNVALNHAIMSPDNKTLITLGDTSNIYVSHPEEDIRRVTDFKTIPTSGDCGFSTAFLPNGLHFLTCFQDGISLIYDLRNTNIPIHEIHSTRPKTQPGAFRVTKTTTNNDDLVFISEHQGRIHMIDTRNFKNHAVIMLPKYLYNVPPAVSDTYKFDEDEYDDENDNHNSEYQTRYPMAISTQNNQGQWFNQPIVKDIEDFKDLNNFGGDLHMGYLDSYKFFDSRYASTSTRQSQYYSRPNLDSDSFNVLLQSTIDREELIRRKGKLNYSPSTSRLLTYLRKHDLPQQHRKCESRYCSNMWWNKSASDPNLNINHLDYRPWGINTPQTKDTVNFMETPERDPFFYVDSDIEINGLDVAHRNGKSTLCIGTKEGIVFWDIDSRQRCSFPSFDCS